MFPQPGALDPAGEQMGGRPGQYPAINPRRVGLGDAVLLGIKAEPEAWERDEEGAASVPEG